MINYSAIGFVAILAVVGVGVDYHQQTQKSDLNLGEMSAGAYLDTVTGRFGEVQAAKEAKVAEKERKSRVRAGARIYLPDAPEGWTRRELVDGDNSRISPPKREISEMEQEALEASTLLKNMAEKSEKKAFETRNAQTWIYERGDEIVSIRAYYTEMPKGNTISGNAMTMVIGNLSGMSIMEGWDVVQGVAYGFYQDWSSDDEKPYRTLNAVVGFGDEVKIDVRTTTSDEVTREILSLIDYDGLNALLPRPLAHVGSGSDTLPDVEGAVLASKMIRIRSELISKRTEAAEKWLVSATNPEDAMTLALRQAGFDIEGSMGDEDRALADVISEIEAKGTETPQEEASLEPSGTEATTRTAHAGEIETAEPQRESGGKRIVSKRLPDDKIQKLITLNETERSVAMAGLRESARRFGQKNGFPEGSCTFSFEHFRAECETVQKDAKADTSGSGITGILGKILDRNEEEAPAAKTTPTRLKLSGGTSCLDNSLGSLCKN